MPTGRDRDDRCRLLYCDRSRIAQRIQVYAERMGWPGLAEESYCTGAALDWVHLGDGVQLSPDLGPHGDRAQRVETAGAEAGLCQWAYRPPAPHARLRVPPHKPRC